MLSTEMFSIVYEGDMGLNELFIDKCTDGASFR